MGLLSEKDLHKIRLFVRTKEKIGKFSKLDIKSIKSRIAKAIFLHPITKKPQKILDANTRIALQRVLRRCKEIYDANQEQNKRNDNIPVPSIANVRAPVFWGNDNDWESSRKILRTSENHLRDPILASPKNY